MRYRPGVERPDLWRLEAHPESVRIGGWTERADCIYAWAMPSASPVARRLRRHYRLVHETGDGRLYELSAGPSRR